MALNLTRLFRSGDESSTVRSTSLGSALAPDRAARVEWVAPETTVGEHRELAQQIAAQIRTAPQGTRHGTRITVLEAPSGTGKSRVVREVYDLLRADRDTYWAPANASRVADSGRAGFGNRKSLGPDPREFVRPANAVPTFSWWHIACERLMDGSVAALTTTLAAQQAAHAEAVTAAVDKTRGGLRVAIDAGREIAVEFGRSQLEGQLQAALVTGVTQLLPVPAPVLDLANQLVRKGAMFASMTRRLRHEEAVGDAQRKDIHARVLGHADAISKLATVDVPAVIVVEDAHLMPAAMAAFIGALVDAGAGNPQRAVHVILTAWPEAADADFRAWLRQTKESGLVRVDTRPVGPLDHESLADIVTELAPATDRETALAVARRLGNPHLIVEWMQSGGVEATVRERGGALPADALEGFSEAADDVATRLYESRWDDLRDDVKRALMLAAFDAERRDGILTYAPEVVLRASDPEPLAEGLAGALNPAHWVHSVDNIGDHYSQDPYAADVMTAKAKRYLKLSLDGARSLRVRRTAAAVEVLNERMARVSLHPETAELPSAQLQRWAAQIVASSGEDVPAVAALVHALGAFHDDRLRDAAYVSLAALGRRVPNAPVERVEAALCMLVLACAAQAPGSVPDGEVTRAAELLERALRTLPDDDHPAVTSRLDELAIRRGGPGARPLPTAADGPDAARRAVVELALVAYETYAASGRKAAVERLATAFAAARDLLGIDDPETLEIASSYLQLLGLDDDARKLEPLTGQLAEAAERTFGADDSRTLDLQRQQLRWELKRAPSAGLAVRYDELAAHIGRVLGPYSWATVRTRYEAAQAWSRTSDGQRGIERIDRLIVELDDVFGSDHAATKRARWFKTYQVEPYALLKHADTSAMQVSSSSDEASAALVDWALLADALDSFYGAGGA